MEVKKLLDSLSVDELSSLRKEIYSEMTDRMFDMQVELNKLQDSYSALDMTAASRWREIVRLDRNYTELMEQQNKMKAAYGEQLRQIKNLQEKNDNQRNQIVHLQDCLRKQNVTVEELGESLDYTRQKLDQRDSDLTKLLKENEKLNAQLDSFDHPDFERMKKRLELLEKENDCLREDISNNLKVPFPIKEDYSVPENEIHFRNMGKTVGVITGIDDAPKGTYKECFVLFNKQTDQIEIREVGTTRLVSHFFANPGK